MLRRSRLIQGGRRGFHAAGARTRRGREGSPETVAGAAAIRAEMRYVAANFRVTGWLWWRKVALPAILPFYVTGAITASGGSWNAAIVAELATWGNTQVEARGLGSYIAEATSAGDFHRIILGIGTMSWFIVVLNRLFWRPLYYYAERKYRLT